MNDDEPSSGDDKALHEKLAALRQEHQDLAAAIDALQDTPMPDQLMVARLKRRKLLLRDEIVKLEDRILPDIIA